MKHLTANTKGYNSSDLSRYIISIRFKRRLKTHINIKTQEPQYQSNMRLLQQKFNLAS